MNNCTDRFCVTGLLKASPAEEGGERFLYIEASNEALDQQGEIILADALAKSADYYLKFGNLDLDHLTQIGPARGIPDYHLFEIGRPIDVQISHPATFVKAQLYKGDGPSAHQANLVWDSLTGTNPPARWYPSVGGAYLGKSERIDPAHGGRVTMVTDVRWTNIALSKTPVNADVPQVSSMPWGVFQKSWIPGIGLDLGKALTAEGAGTDAAALGGGAALGRQSLDGAVTTYWEFRDRLAAALKQRQARNQTAAGLSRFAVEQMGLGEDRAVKWVGRFLNDLKTGLKRKHP